MIESSTNSLAIFHEQILKLWSNKIAQLTDFVPMIYPEFKPDSLLFIGINPSYDVTAVMRVLKDTQFEETLNNRNAVDNYFKYSDTLSSSRLADFQLIQQYHREKLNYFKRHRQLSCDLGNMPWEQIDLFQVRNSTQKKVTDFLKEKINEHFFQVQINSFLQLLERIKPRAIVILNKKAGNLLKKQFNNIDKCMLIENKQNDYTLNLKGNKIPLLISKHVQFIKECKRKEINQEIISFVNDCRQ